VIPTGDGTRDIDNKVKKNAESSSSENRILASRDNVMVVAQRRTKRATSSHRSVGNNGAWKQHRDYPDVVILLHARNSVGLYTCQQKTRRDVISHDQGSLLHYK